jgi:para-aminobenzoate synthetase component 2
MIYFVDHFDSFSFNVISWLRSAWNCPELKRVMADDKDSLAKVRTAGFPVVLSPGPKSPMDYPMSLELCRELAGQVPLLGICLGHQIMGTVFGWRIKKSTLPFHGSRRLIHATGKPSRFLGPADTLLAATYNSLVIEPPAKVGGCTFFHTTAICENSEVQIIESETAAFAAGVQFHPESFLSDGHVVAAIRDRWLESADDWLARKHQISATAPLLMPS